MRNLASLNTSKADESHKSHKEVVSTTAGILFHLTYFEFDQCSEEAHRAKSSR